MKNCRKLTTMLSAYVDKELNEADTALIEEHIPQCAQCRRELAHYSRLKQLVAEQERKTLPDDYLITRVWEKITAYRDLPGNAFWADLGILARRFLPVPAVVAAVFLIIMITTPLPQTPAVSFEDTLFNGAPVSVETVLGVILGVQD